MATEEPLTPTDADLVTRAQRGDAGAFEALVSRYRGRVYGLCLHRVGDTDEANDVAQDRDASVRGSAAGALGRAKDARVVDVLIPMLRDPDIMVHRWAAEALGRVGNPKAIPALLELMLPGQPNSYWAASALVQLGDPSAIAPLRDLAGDPATDPKVRQDAEWALKALAERQAG